MDMYAFRKHTIDNKKPVCSKIVCCGFHPETEHPVYIGKREM